MFSWMRRDEQKRQGVEVHDTVAEGLQRIYKQKLLPLELEYNFHDFHSPMLEEPDFDARPMIMLVGQYSTGKTTFIRYLLEQDFPGIHIGPEPTTDRFIALMHGDSDRVVPGNALVVDPKRQFRALSKFGNAFLSRFQCSSTNSPVLKGVSIVDTPGILSGEKQRLDRGYDFMGVLEWFAARVDRILLLFDAHKLDISDEFKRAIEGLRGHDEKIRIVLNKADMVDHQQLMRVYGALMWSLGKVMKTPEVTRVYIGSFWDQPLHFDYNRGLFEAEQQDLFKDLQSLPRNAALRKLNDLIKRARLAKVHAILIGALKKEMPSVFRKESKKKELIKNLHVIYTQIEREHKVSRGDFPSIEKMTKALEDRDFTKFKPLDKRLLEKVEDMLANDIAQLMSQIPLEEKAKTDIGGDRVKGGVFDSVMSQDSPFTKRNQKVGEDEDADEPGIPQDQRFKYKAIFTQLSPTGTKISGAVAREELLKSKLASNTLSKIWKLADVDKDGMLDEEEFALAMHFVNGKISGKDLPNQLPKHLVPKNKVLDQYYDDDDDDY